MAALAKLSVNLVNAVCGDEGFGPRPGLRLGRPWRQSPELAPAALFLVHGLATKLQATLKGERARQQQTFFLFCSPIAYSPCWLRACRRLALMKEPRPGGDQ